MSRPPSGHGLSDAQAQIDMLEATCEELDRQGRRACVAHLTVCEDHDVRLLVGSPGDGPNVELLGPFAERVQGTRWHAVQVERDTRTVWAGPPLDCCAADLLRFVDQLLHPEAALRSAPYRRLG